MARSIKKKKDLDNPRVREKLEIERRYWAKHGVDWKLVTEDEINQQKAKNIEWLFQASGLPETFGNLEFFEECLSCFEDIYFRTDYSIFMVAKDSDRHITIGWICSTAGLRECEIKGKLHRFPEIRAFV
mgnify:FL=1